MTAINNASESIEIVAKGFGRGIFGADREFIDFLMGLKLAKLSPSAT